MGNTLICREFHGDSIGCKITSKSCQIRKILTNYRDRHLIWPTRCVDKQENGKSTNTLSSSRLPSNFSPSSLGCAYRRRSEFSLSPLYLFSTYCSSTNLFVPSSLSTSDRVNNEWSLSLFSLSCSLSSSLS